MKASVVPFAKPTRTLETCLRCSKACGRPHSQSAKFLFITRICRNFAHVRTVWASKMTISKWCDVPSCYLFVVVAVCVCVCVREPVVYFCFEDGITCIPKHCVKYVAIIFVLVCLCRFFWQIILLTYMSLIYPGLDLFQGVFWIWNHYPLTGYHI